jgi:hypothetical protein
MPKTLRKGVPNYNRLRHLTQFEKMSDEKFDEWFATRVATLDEDEEFDRRLNEKLKEFEQDYDISDLKVNDQLMLRSMMQSIITVEDLNRMAYGFREEDLGQDDILVAEKINRMITDQLKAISQMQDDLEITRKIRKGRANESVQNTLETIKQKAKIFYDKKMFVVTCPKCKKWIFSGWFLFPDGKNKIVLTCNSTTDVGGKCGEVITITSKELLDKRGFNMPELFPESLI